MCQEIMKFGGCTYLVFFLFFLFVCLQKLWTDYDETFRKCKSFTIYKLVLFKVFYWLKTDVPKCYSCPGPIFTKGLSQGLGLKLRLLSQVSAQNLLRLLS